MKTLLIGYFGYNNAGDDAFIKTTQWAFNRYNINTKLFATSNKTYGSEYGEVKPIYSALIPERFDLRYRQAKFKYISNRFNMCLFNGGSNFHSSNSLRHWNRCFNHNSKQLICAVGVSIGPFKDTDAEKACKELLKKFDLVAVRDDASYNRIASMNLDINFHKTNDLALMISKASSHDALIAHEDINDNIIGVSVCDQQIKLNDGSVYDQKKFYVNLIDKLLNNNLSNKVMLFAFNANDAYGDRHICTNIIDSLPKFRNRIFYYEYDGNINNILSAMIRMKCFIGMRLHSIVFSYSISIPFIMVPYHEKCYEFINTIHAKKCNILTKNQINSDIILEDILNGIDVLDNTKSIDEAELNYIHLSKLVC